MGVHTGDSVTVAAADDAERDEAYQELATRRFVFLLVYLSQEMARYGAQDPAVEHHSHADARGEDPRDRDEPASPVLRARLEGDRYR